MLAVLVGMVLATAGCGGSTRSSARPPATSRPSTTTRPTPTTVAGSTITGAGAFLGPILIVAVGSITMSYRQFGSGPELVIVAGQASPMSEWPVGTLRLLSQHWHVTMYDDRSLGSTTDDLSTPLTMDEMGDDLVGLIGALGLRRPAVFGWSTGGEIALVAASRHPRAIGRLAVTGAEPGGPTSDDGPPANTALLEDPNASPVALLGLLFGTDSTAESAFIQDLGSVPQTPVSAAVTQRYARCESAYIGGRDRSVDLRRLDVPTLVMNGRDDQLVPFVNAQRIAADIPGARLELEPGGHAWFYEHPELFIPVLQSFLG